MAKRKIIPITEGAAGRKRPHRGGRCESDIAIEAFAPDEAARERTFPKSYGDLPLFVRLRFSPIVPAFLVLTGILFTGAGILDRLPVMSITGGLFLLIGAAWFFNRGHLYRFVLRSGGSSPRTPCRSGRPAAPDDDRPAGPYNDSIVTRG